MYLIVNHTWLHLIGGKAWAQSAAMRFGGRAITLLAVIVGWVFFRAKTAPQALALLGGMSGLHGAGLPLQLRPLLAPLHLGFANAPFKVQDLWIIAVAGVIALFAPNTDELFRLALPAKQTATEPRAAWNPSARWAVFTAFVLGISVFKLSGVTEFLYFQF